MDIGRAFTYVFDDEKWLSKIVMGGVFIFLSVFLIGIPFILGYLVETVRNVASEEASPLPEWSDLGNKFAQGLSLAIALLIYSIPLIILACMQGFFGGVGDDNTAVSLISACFGCLAALYGLVLAAIYPAIIIRYAATGEIMAAFRFGEIVTLISQNLGNYIVAVILGWVVTNVIAGFRVILCVVGVLFTYFWAYLVEAHLLGQVQRQAGMEGTVTL